MPYGVAALSSYGGLPMGTTGTAAATAPTWQSAAQLAAIQSGGGLLAQGFNRLFRRKDIQRQYEMNKKMADYQFSKNLDMWNMQNAYNSPAAQMERLKAAGLNPRLMYGGGASSGPAASGQARNLPTYSATRTDTSNVMPVDTSRILSDYLDIKTKSAQIDLVNEQRRKAQWETDILESAFMDILDEKSGKADKSILDAKLKNILYNDSRWERGAKVGGTWDRLEKGLYGQRIMTQLSRYMSDASAAEQNALIREYERRMKGYESKYYKWGYWGNLAKGIAPAIGLVRGRFGRGIKTPTKIGGYQRAYYKGYDRIRNQM